MMIQIIWYWVIFPILDMEKETMRFQDEHDCLALITKQIIQIQRVGGFWTEVCGKQGCVKVWIHFITGDTSGHNNLVGHMNGSKI